MQQPEVVTIETLTVAVRFREVEDQRLLLSNVIEGERVERVRVEAALHRSEERMLDEQVRVRVGIFLWGVGSEERNADE